MSTPDSAVDRVIANALEQAFAGRKPPIAIEQSISFLGIEINAYALVLIILAVVFLVAIWRASSQGRLDWLDLLTRDGRKVSTTKILQLVGGVVATWIIVKLTLQSALTWDIFAIYLCYVASIDGFSKIVLAKYGVKDSAAGSKGAVPFDDK